MSRNAIRDDTPAVSDPLHSESPAGVRWTTRNFSEAMPGVPTALSWSIWGPGMRFASIQDYRWMGALSRSELAALERGDRSASAIYYGHVAGNVDLMSLAVSRMPGSSSASFERDYFGIEPSDQTPRQTKRRLAIVLPKLLLLARQHPARLQALATETDRWWRTSTEGVPDPPTARLLLHDAAERFKMAMAIHSIQSTFAQAAFASASKIAADAGRPGAEMQLVTGSGTLEELHVARDLWRVSRRELDLQRFLADHGYHGPNEGELSARSWREDDGPVLAAVAAFETRGDDDSPGEHVRRIAEQRSAAVEEILRSMTGRIRSRTQAALDKAARDVAAREVGKAAFLKILDVARFAARHIAVDLVARRELDEVDDVFHLTLEEIERPPTPRLVDIVSSRRATRQRYIGMALPEYWVGNPAPVDPDRTQARVGSITGLAASGGVVEGTARVVLDPEADVEPLDSGEILVAATTDPGWLTLFMGAGGMAVDVGGPMSHAAIVARELGIPCVINTIDGTRRISTGDRIRVDGTTGTVEILTS